MSNDGYTTPGAPTCQQPPTDSQKATLDITTAQCVATSSALQNGDARSLAESPDVRELWTRYKSDPSQIEVRNELAMKYWPWVINLAKRAKRLIDSKDDVESLASVGFEKMLGIMKAFRADRGAAFTSYAFRGVLAGMLRSEVPDSVSKLRKLIYGTRVSESHRRGYRINECELAEVIGISEQVLSSRIRQCIVRTTRSEEKSPAFINARSSSSPVADALRDEACEMVRFAIKYLTPAQTRSVAGYIMEDTPASEVASSAGISVTSVMRHIGAASNRLRPRLESLAPTENGGRAA